MKEQENVVDKFDNMNEGTTTTISKMGHKGGHISKSNKREKLWRGIITHVLKVYGIL